MLCFLISTALCLSSTTIQYIYPIFKTWESVKSNTPSKQWLSYWVIFSALLLIESFTFSLSAWAITHIVKILFCLWLIHPEFLGASFLHDLVLDKGFAVADQFVGPYLKPLLNKKERSE